MTIRKSAAPVKAVRDLPAVEAPRILEHIKVLADDSCEGRAPGTPGEDKTVEYLTAKLRSLSKELGLGEVRGRGLLVALELGKDVGSKVVDAALRQKLLINSPRPACLRFMPALNVTRQEIDTMLSTLKPILQKET